jgi:phage tail sheath protein FI
MAVMKTPGVYIIEKNAFPNSVVQVATAVPAFIGYTEKALNGNRSLKGQPFRLSSMKEFETYFGGPAEPEFDIMPFAVPAADAVSPMDEAGVNMKDTTLVSTFIVKGASGKPETLQLKPVGEEYCLYGAMRLFFQNGGGSCYIVSIGKYDDAISADEMLKGIDSLIKEQEPTMVVIPETTRLSRAESIKVQQQMLAHCGTKMKNRFALLDIFAGHLDTNSGNPVKAFRDDLGINDLDYGAAYYPWVKTSVYSARDFTFQNLSRGGRDKLITLLKRSVSASGQLSLEQATVVNDEIALVAAPPELADNTVATGVKKPVTIETGTPGEKIDFTTVKLTEPDQNSGDRVKTVEKVGVWTLEDDGTVITFAPAAEFLTGSADIKFTAKATDGTDLPEKVVTVIMRDGPPVENIDKTLRVIAPLYNDIMTEIATRLNTMAPSAAMAGIYTMVDASRGVWKAPANVSLNSVTAPTVNISNDDQEDLNVTPQGKSINAIRPFVGEGVLVWGARTLDGNSLDWRYINVRRTMIMLEESIRLASKAYVFEPNVSTTWVTIRSMIENFLTGIWKQGGLAGAVPTDAFSVRVGLGETMTPVDILEGILRITVLVAISRPAEFIEITFMQQMQKS